MALNQKLLYKVTSTIIYGRHIKLLISIDNELLENIRDFCFQRYYLIDFFSQESLHSIGTL